MPSRPPMRDVVDIDLGTPYPCYSVGDPTALVQVIGWLKSTCVFPSVYFRGQSSLYGGRLVPSGLRHDTSTVGEKGIATHDRAMGAYLDEFWGSECNCLGRKPKYTDTHLCTERATKATPSLYRGTRRACLEPLLQHYGLRTRWIDLVDNVWVALWFASYEYVSADRGRFAYLRPRAAEPDAHAYVLIVDAGPLEATAIPGYWLGEDVRLIDLRYALPSTYVRPHSQHGLLAGPRGPMTSTAVHAVEKNVRAAVRIDLGLARTWLGRGSMIDTYTVFPSAVRDEGYRRLLRFAPSPPESLGALTQIGTGY